MFNHEPKHYLCPFCSLAQGRNAELSMIEDIVFENNKTIAFVSAKWWVSNPGHVIVIPKNHYENIYDIPDDVHADVYKTAKRIAIAIRKTYSCDGTSLRQHNEPAGNQDVWHFHVHVFPRYKDDNLYIKHKETQIITDQKSKKPFVDKLKKYLVK